jgi:YidC/Oxa1 family membrane protein insertase
VDKRTLYALVAMLALFLIFDTFVWKPQRRQKALATQETTQNPSPAPVDSTGGTLTDSLVAAGPAVVFDSLSAPDAKAEQLTLKNDKVTVTFSSKGAEITQIELANYKMSGSEQVKLVNSGSSIAGVSLVTPDSKQSLSNVIFRHKLTDSGRNLVFYLGEETNPSFEKIYSLDATYGITMAVKAHSIANVKGMELDFAGGIADSEEYLRSKAQDYKFLLYTNQLQKFTVGNLKKKPPPAM